MLLDYIIDDHVSRMVDCSKVLQKQLTMMGFFDVTSDAIRG
jgi:hypothetical protein